MYYLATHLFFFQSLTVDSQLIGEAVGRKTAILFTYFFKITKKHSLWISYILIIFFICFL